MRRINFFKCDDNTTFLFKQFPDSIASQVNTKSKMPPKNTNKTTEFSWTDDEIQLLLSSACAYKSECEYAGINWESTKSKYEKIRELFYNEYPVIESDKFPHYEHFESDMTKERITAKLKRVRTSFKQAVDAGKRSGGGHSLHVV